MHGDHGRPGGPDSACRSSGSRILRVAWTACTISARSAWLYMSSTTCTAACRPAATVQVTPTGIGWAAEPVLHLELNTLWGEVDQHAAIDSPANAAMRRSDPDIFLCSSDLEAVSFELFKEIGEHESTEELSSEVIVELPAANYLGVFVRAIPTRSPVASARAHSFMTMSFCCPKRPEGTRTCCLSANARPANCPQLGSAFI